MEGVEDSFVSEARTFDPVPSLHMMREGDWCSMEGSELFGEGYHRTWHASVRFGRTGDEGELGKAKKGRKSCIHALIQPLPTGIYADDYELLRHPMGAQMAQGCGDATIELPTHLSDGCRLISFSASSSWNASWTIHARYAKPGFGYETYRLPPPMAVMDCGDGWSSVPVISDTTTLEWSVPRGQIEWKSFVLVITLLSQLLGAFCIVGSALRVRLGSVGGSYPPCISETDTGDATQEEGIEEKKKFA